MAHLSLQGYKLKVDFILMKIISSFSGDICKACPDMMMCRFIINIEITAGQV